MLSYKQFLRKAQEDFIDYLPEEYSDHSIQIKEVTKVNEVKDAMIISKDSNEPEMITPVFYFQDMYKEYKKTENYEATLKMFSEFYVNSVKPKLPNFNMENLEQIIREKTVLQVVNSIDNEELLSACPNLTFLDLKIIFRVIISIEPDGISSFILTNDICDSYEIDLDELFGLAYKNSISILGREEKTMRDVLTEAMIESGIELDHVDEMLSQSVLTSRSDRITLITDKYKFLGANLILYPNYLKSIADKYDSSLLIIPSSIRDLMIVPETDFDEIDEIKQIILDVNRVQLNPEDRLSDSLYLFDRDLKEVFIIHGGDVYEE